MDSMTVVSSLVLGILLGALAGWLLTKATMAQDSAEELAEAKVQSAALLERILSRDQEIAQLLQRLNEFEEECAKLRGDLLEESNARATAEEKARSIPELKDAEEQLRNMFKALSAQALNENSQSFLTLAKSTLERYQSEAQGDLAQREKAVETLVSPLKETLEKYDQQIQAIEKSRSEAYGSLSQQVQSLLKSQQKLEAETGNLVKALRMPQVRGRWGELTLRRVVELAGMVPYCDFEEQQSLSTENGKLRPDMTVRLPGGKNIVVDAKAPIQAYLDALDAADEESRRLCLQAHARQIRARLQDLSSKAYWDRLDSTPEFVILFIPGESFYGAALEQDPQLIEDGVAQRVILATPLTLIALLRAVAFGWRQEKIAENARQISDLGKELYERVSVLTEHLRGLGKSLGGSVDAYNKFIGSLESRVLVSARKFKELGSTAQEDILELAPIEQSIRTIQGQELLVSNEEKIGGSEN